MTHQSVANPVLLRIENIFVRYYKKDILSGVSIELSPGQIVALVGANGAGKSTLLKAIGGIVHPYAGRILMGGNDITQISTTQLASLGIGYLLQGDATFPSLTVMEHLLMTAKALQGDSFKRRTEEVWRIYPHFRENKNKRAGLLSGGERQMLGIAMLLMQDSRVWLLDEPSGGLAPKAVRSVMDTIKDLTVKNGISVILVEQNLREAIRIADSAYAIKRGGAFLIEHPSEILNNGKMEEIFFT